MPEVLSVDRWDRMHSLPTAIAYGFVSFNALISLKRGIDNC